MLDSQSSNTAMDDTMSEIYGADLGVAIDNRKKDLLKDISNIEKNIRDAQKIVKQSNDEPYSYDPISPELANERQKNIVFLKKDLEKKRTEIDELI